MINFILYEGENTDQKYNEIIKDILLEKEEYIIYFEKKECLKGFSCINPKCEFIHPSDHNINEKKKYPKYKSTICKDGNNCSKNEYNLCRFKHDNDPYYFHIPR